MSKTGRKMKWKSEEAKQKSLANLKPVKPGEARNPLGGRGHNISIRGAIKKKLDAEYKHKTNKEKRNYLAIILDKIIDGGIDKKDRKILMDVLRYVEPPTQKIEITNESILQELIPLIQKYVPDNRFDEFEAEVKRLEGTILDRAKDASMTKSENE